MALFNFGKKKEQSCCCCGFDAETKIAGPTVEKGNDELKSIKVLGAGCGSCHEMYENTKQAVKSLGLNIEVGYITDMQKVMEFGVMSMPALVINDKVMSMGKILKPSEIEKKLNIIREQN